MARLKYPRDVPPNGFWFIQKESFLRLEGESLKDLAEKVVAHRKYRGYEPTDFATVALEVERQICSRLGVYHCKPEGNEDNWVPIDFPNTVLKLGTVVGASKALFAYLASGLELVTPEKAKERADKCARCPINWPLTGCKCGALYKLLEKAVPKEKRFANLGVCVICQCSLPAKVWLPRKVIDASNEGRDLKFPRDGSCWQYEED